MAFLKKLTFVALAALLLAGLAARPAAAQEDEGGGGAIQGLMEKAVKQLEAKDYDGALATFAAIRAETDKAGLNDEQKREVMQLVHYNSACAYSLKGDKEKALDAFEKSLDAGFADWEHIGEDTDLDAIRKEPRFEAAITKHKAAAEHEKTAALEHEKDEIRGRIAKDAVFPFDFELTAIDGSPVKLADYRGKVVLVDVWGTWCPPCRAEIPHLVELYQALAPKGFAIVGLNSEKVAKEKQLDTVKAFVAEQKIPYTCALIDRAFTQKIPGFEGYPTMLLIDRQGRVRLKQVGYTEGPVLAAAIEALLAEPAGNGAGAGDGAKHGEF
jgi:thiol-disulfide isomerase/thioredoxin